MNTITAKTFISYSWDTQENMQWVKDLATRLRQDGIDVVLDQWEVAYGEQLPQFMERAVRDSDYVLVICTPEYKRKSDSRIGAVGYEGHIMTGQILSGRAHRKFIPILRHEDWKDAAPSWLEAESYLDLHDGAGFEKSYQELLATLLGFREMAPRLGSGSEHIALFSGPRNIPSVKGFVGREADLALLRTAKEEGKTAFVLHGQAGVGKTILALRFIEEMKDDFNAHIKVDMQAFSENTLSPTEARLEVIKWFEPNVPPDLSAKEIDNLYVSHLNRPNRRTILFLDNVRDREQVGNLNQKPAVVVITSRSVFNVDEGFDLHVGQMSSEDARDLLHSIAGAGAFQGQEEQLAQLAGHLPIALKTLASMLAEDKFQTATHLIEQYRDKKKLLKQRVPGYRKLPAEAEDLTINASFELSYMGLPAELQRRWRWLSVFPSDFDEKTIKSCFGITEAEAKATQEQLRKLSLLEGDPDTRRFRFHDLAREFADSKFDDPLGRPFLERLHVHIVKKFPWLFMSERYCAQGAHANYFAWLLRHATYRKHTDPEGGFMDALGLLDTEWANIVAGQKWAAVHKDDEPAAGGICSDYACSASELLNLRLTKRQYLTWQESALAAANRLGDKRRQSMHLNNLGTIYNDLGDYEKAVEHFTKGLEIARKSKNEDCESDILGGLVNAYAIQGDYKKAIEYAEIALNLARQSKFRESEGSILAKLIAIHHGLGAVRKALEFHRESLKIAVEAGELYHQSTCLHNLSLAYIDLGEPEKARECQEQSARISRQIGDKRGERDDLYETGHVYSTEGNYESAIESYEKALESAREEGDRRDEAMGLHNLAVHHLQFNEYEKAIEYLRQALQINSEIKNRDGEVNCLSTLATAFGGLGDDISAFMFAGQALELSRAIGDRLSEGNNLYKLGLALACMGELKEACNAWHDSLQILECIEAARADQVREAINQFCN